VPAAPGADAGRAQRRGAARGRLRRRADRRDESRWRHRQRAAAAVRCDRHREREGIEMSTWLRVATALLLTACDLALAQGQAAAFPSRPLRIYVPFNAGSGADSSSRFYGELLGKMFGQQVLVENKPGGSGVLAVQATRQ